MKIELDRITVAIINNGSLTIRSVVDTGQVRALDDATAYRVNDGSIIHHNPSHGIVVLAKKILDTIKE